VLFKNKAKSDGQQSDEEIVAGLQRSMDADRFTVLYDRYSAKVFQKCVGMTRDKELAGDLTHDIFIKAFVNLSKFDHRSRFGTWLYSITYNYCLDHLRKAKRRRSDDLDEEQLDLAMPEDSYEQELLGLQAERLDGVLAALEPGDRAMLLMKYQDELSVKDIMETLELSESAVKMRMLRARERALAMYHQLHPEEA
jgi:RNA polymerase sigma-70 factor (ECF subfamily)